jgi:hypothetical protein
MQINPSVTADHCPSIQVGHHCVHDVGHQWVWVHCIGHEPHDQVILCGTASNACPLDISGYSYILYSIN